MMLLNNKPPTTCKNLISKQNWIDSSVKLNRCSKEQASAQWTNVKNCLCYGTGPSSSKGLSVPVIIIISVASVAVVSLVIYLLMRKTKG